MGDLFSNFTSLPVFSFFTKIPSLAIGIVAMVICAVIALWGHKIYNIVAGLCFALVGFAVASTIASIFIPSTPIVLVVALVAAILMFLIGYFYCLAIGVGLITLLGVLLTTGVLMLIIDISSINKFVQMLLMLAIVGAWIIIGAIIYILFDLAIYLITAFGGAIACFASLTLIIPFRIWIALIPGILFGVIAFLFQITGGFGVKLKDLKISSLMKNSKKKSKGEAVRDTEESAQIADTTDGADNNNQDPDIAELESLEKEMKEEDE